MSGVDACNIGHDVAMILIVPQDNLTVAGIVAMRWLITSPKATPGAHALGPEVLTKFVAILGKSRLPKKEHQGSCRHARAPLPHWTDVTEKDPSQDVSRTRYTTQTPQPIARTKEHQTRTLKLPGHRKRESIQTTGSWPYVAETSKARMTETVNATKADGKSGHVEEASACNL